jgi:iron complex transport system substrate-binding protein
MNILRPLFILIVINVLLLTGCLENKTPANSSNQSVIDTLSVEFAKGFSAYQHENYWELIIHSPYPGAQKNFTYLLLPHDIEVPEHTSETQIIRTPVERLIATSTTHVPLLDYLEATNTLVGFPNPDYISSDKMRRRIDSGKVSNIGIDHAMEMEKILALDPDMIMAYSMSSDLGQMERLRTAGIPYILNADYLETHPLGRAEWIKVAGLLLGKSAQADSVFSAISSDYQRLLTISRNISDQPSVFSGVVYGDTWFLPGGQNYAASLMNDAGMNYLWSDNSSSGFLELSFESVLEKAQNASLWIGVASFHSLEEMKASEPRYELFKAFQDENVYTYNKRIGATGGNEYLELGYLRPDIILADLIHIAHPDKLPHHSLYFYTRLE